MITQKQIIDYISDNIENIGSITNKPISYFQNVRKFVHCISQDDEAIKGFEKMIEYAIGGVGVVNSKGELIGAFSVSDLKLVSKDKYFFSKLYKNATEFLEILDETYWKRPYTLKTVTLKDTLEDVINLLKIWELHRVYVIDDNNKPIGVVGIKECLQEILSS